MKNYRGLRRSISDFRRHPWLHTISISTITIALLILGFFFLSYRNFENLAEKTSPKITGTVYLREGLSENEIQSLRDRLLGSESVQKAIFKPKTSVMEDLSAFLGNKDGTNLPGGELFPDVLELEIRKETTTTSIAALKTIISKYSEVAEADFSEDWLAQFHKVRQLLRICGLILMLGILISCSFMIANFMSMRHQSRKNEIEIVKLVGAHPKFILAPFLWEGLIEGLLGSGVALILLYVLKLFLTAIISTQWSTLLGFREWLYLSTAQLLAVVAIGIAMAFLGSFTVFLRFQENESK